MKRFLWHALLLAALAVTVRAALLIVRVPFTKFVKS